ncbi:major facilitator superfamily domain-containing protein [Trametes meyenii]|nr:major facilitator superfamily domain-containing protein [Trametes meyenii]
MSPLPSSSPPASTTSMATPPGDLTPAPKTELQVADPPPTPTTKRGWRFWLVFLSLCLSLFLTALDLASVYTALPSIVHDLHGADSFVWVSSAYTLSCAAVLPMSGRLADIFGRQAVLLVAIVLFAAGSAVTGAATSMRMIIAGRTIQGVGSGAIQVLVAIVTADLIPLKERGFFQSITGATFSVASATGPFIGGALSQHASWRWLFYLNLPLCGLAFAVVLVFLRLRKPPIESYKKTFLAVDWIGNAIIIASATSCIVGLTWAGIRYPWASAQVIAPLVVGVLGLCGALAYDAWWAAHPVIPTAIIKHRTTLGGYIGSFFHIMVANSITFYLPTYFQAAKVASPLLSGLYIFPTVICISPAAILQGILVSKTGRYRLINFIGWCGMATGVGLLTLLDARTPVAVSVPFQMLAAVGVGLVYSTTFAVLAPLEPAQNAAALSFLLFMRTFSSVRLCSLPSPPSLPPSLFSPALSPPASTSPPASASASAFAFRRLTVHPPRQAWASSISATIFQNGVRARLPAAFLARIPPDQDVAYAGIPLIPLIAGEGEGEGEGGEALQREVRAAFAESVRVVWFVALGLCAAGVASVGMMRHVPLHGRMDARFGMRGKEEEDGQREARAEVGESSRSEIELDRAGKSVIAAAEKRSVVDAGELVAVVDSRENSS